MKNYDIIIVGAGPSGLFASINLNQSMNVLLLEKNDIIGSKLLMSGSGQCNFTNIKKINKFYKHYGNNGKFLKKSFKNFSNKDLITFFENNNIKTYINKKGKVFPKSLNSKEIVNFLIKKCKENGVKIKRKEKVIKITKKKSLFRIKTKNNIYNSKKVIISTGGKSYPTTGSSGDGYNFAKNFNHSIVTPKPALSSIEIKNYKFKEKAGYSIKKCIISIYRKNKTPLKKIKEFYGDILFTHDGLSGPGIINNSRYFRKKDILKINFINKKRNDFRRKFINDSQNQGKSEITNYLITYNLDKSFIKYILKISNIKQDKKIASINKMERKKLEENLCEYKFQIDKIKGFNYAMATKGGILLDEVSNKTMESKLIDNLYFIGEVLDIDGDTGGYNIQAAMSTAYICAKNIKTP